MQSTTRVMIIDDDPDFISLLKCQLDDASNNYKIDAVNTLNDGLEAVRHGKHDIYLVDYELDSGNTGDEIIDEANTLMRTTVMITGYEDPELGDRIINSGASDFLTKPHINGTLLDRVIRNTLGRRQRLVELLEQQKELTKQLSYDPLTGLLGRAVLKEQIEVELRDENARGAMLYIDLDGFKPVNDRHGHAAGDLVLQQVASRLIECLQPNDIVGRIGGDEFVIYLKFDQAVEQATSIAALVTKKVLSVVSDHYFLTETKDQFNVTVSLSASIGITMIPADTRDYEELLSFSDRAMYRAKKNGKNDFCFHQSLESKIKDASN